MHASFAAASAIRIQFLNAEGEAILYLGQPNSGTLILTNLSGATIELAPGAPADPPPAGGAFSIVVSFAELFTAASGQASLQISAPGWQSRFFDGDFPAWVLTPSQPVSWHEATDLRFAVSALTPTVAQNSYYVAVDLFNLSGNYEDSQLVSVSVANPPNGKKDLRDTLSFQLMPDVVNGTKSDEQVIENTLELRFANTDLKVPIVPAGVPWESTPPRFVVSFVYGTAPGYFALTTTTAAANFHVGLGTGSSGWSTNLDHAAEPQWAFTPLNHEILGTGLNSLVTFQFANVVTQFAKGPTQIYISWSNVPGYADGRTALFIEKRYLPVEIKRFAINTSRVVAGDEAPKVYLDWLVDNAMLVELSGVGPVSRHKLQFEVTIEQNRSFVLTAIDPITGTVVTTATPLQVTLAPTLSSRLIPPGVIVLWSGVSDSVPDGFAICNGDNLTPPLFNRFILGAGGGAKQAPLDSGVATHRHDISGWSALQVRTTEDGRHDHPFPDEWYGRKFDTKNRYSIGMPSYREGEEDTREVSGHTHTVDLSVPALRSEENTPSMRPRWLALLYIMKRWAG